MLTLPQGLLLGGYSSFSIKWCPRVWFHHVLSSTSRKAPVPGVRQRNSHSSFQVLSSVTFQPPCFVRKAWNLETKKTQVPKKGQKKSSATPWIVFGILPKLYLAHCFPRNLCPMQCQQVHSDLSFSTYMLLTLPCPSPARPCSCTNSGDGTGRKNFSDLPHHEFIIKAVQLA